MVPSYDDTVRARLLGACEADQNGCWRWGKSLTRDGYGQISVRGRMKLAHRVSYELLVGPIAEHLVIDRLCRVRDCLNPEHMDPVTPIENTYRGLDARLWRHGTHCKRGHAFNDENTYFNAQGNAVCRPCQRIRQKLKYQRRSELGLPQRKATPRAGSLPTG